MISGDYNTAFSLIPRNYWELSASLYRPRDEFVLVLRPVRFWPVLVIVIGKMIGMPQQYLWTDRNTVFHNRPYSDLLQKDDYEHELRSLSRSSGTYTD